MRIYSIVIPGTVPGAGMRITSAPASAKSTHIIFPDDILTTLRQNPCSMHLLPAISMIRSPNSSLNFLRVWVIAAFVTPTPGLPVSTMKSTPISIAFRAFATVAARPDVRFHSPFVSTALAASGSSGSRLMPTARPVRRFTSRIVSSVRRRKSLYHRRIHIEQIQDEHVSSLPVILCISEAVQSRYLLLIVSHSPV